MPNLKKANTNPEKSSAKKIFRKQIEEKIALALAGMIADIYDKKFRKHLKKAVRILSEDLSRESEKSAPKIIKKAATAKKDTVKKKIVKTKAATEA